MTLRASLLQITAGRPLGSLRGQLLRWLILPLVLLVALNAVSLYRDALEAADVAYDRSLLSSTRALPSGFRSRMARSSPTCPTWRSTVLRPTH